MRICSSINISSQTPSFRNNCSLLRVNREIPHLRQINFPSVVSLRGSNLRDQFQWRKLSSMRVSLRSRQYQVHSPSRIESKSVGVYRAKYRFSDVLCRNDLRNHCCISVHIRSPMFQCILILFRPRNKDRPLKFCREHRVIHSHDFREDFPCAREHYLYLLSAAQMCHKRWVYA
jgi:hypothetical protein